TDCRVREWVEIVFSAEEQRLSDDAYLKGFRSWSLQCMGKGSVRNLSQGSSLGDAAAPHLCKRFTAAARARTRPINISLSSYLMETSPALNHHNQNGLRVLLKMFVLLYEYEWPQ
ncbi:unnamed protein product, partial [Pleuronectes platessa]